MVGAMLWALAALALPRADVAGRQAVLDNGRPVSEIRTLLPSVDCVRAITVNTNDTVALRTLRLELSRIGLWSRTAIQKETPDPEVQRQTSNIGTSAHRCTHPCPPRPRLC